MVNLASTKAQNTARLLALMGKTADIFRSAWRDQNTAKWRELEMRAELAREQKTEAYRETRLGLAGKREARAEEKFEWEQRKYTEGIPLEEAKLGAREAQTAATEARTGIMGAKLELARETAGSREEKANRGLVLESMEGLETEGKTLAKAKELADKSSDDVREILAGEFSKTSVAAKVGLGAILNKGDVKDVIKNMGVDTARVMADLGRALASLPEGRQPETFLDALEFMPHKELRDALKAEYERHPKDAKKAEVGWGIDRELIYASGALALQDSIASGRFLDYTKQYPGNKAFLERMLYGEVLSDEWRADMQAWTRKRKQPDLVEQWIPGVGD